MSLQLPSRKVIKRLVKYCLREDIGKGDVTARLTPRESQIDGKIISREEGIICGIPWVDEVFKQIGKRHKTQLDINWQVKDGCLLYTSPSPRDQRGSRMPSSA